MKSSVVCYSDRYYIAIKYEYEMYTQYIHPDGKVYDSACSCSRSCSGEVCGWPGLFSSREHAQMILDIFLTEAKVTKIDLEL